MRRWKVCGRAPSSLRQALFASLAADQSMQFVTVVQPHRLGLLLQPLVSVQLPQVGQVRLCQTQHILSLFVFFKKNWASRKNSFAAHDAKFTLSMLCNNTMSLVCQQVSCMLHYSGRLHYNSEDQILPSPAPRVPTKRFVCPPFWMCAPSSVTATLHTPVAAE